MATTVLDDCFLHDAEDPADYIVLSYLGDSYQVSPSLGGGVESGYASGRSRLWSTEDDTVTISLSLEGLTRDVHDWLVAHRGRPLCFRDLYGRKIFCGFHGAPMNQSTMPRHMAEGFNTGSLTLTSITWDEAAS